jgi:hypothetical protein
MFMLPQNTFENGNMYYKCVYKLYIKMRNVQHITRCTIIVMMFYNCDDVIQKYT